MDHKSCHKLCTVACAIRFVQGIIIANLKLNVVTRVLTSGEAKRSREKKIMQQLKQRFK